MTAYLSALCYLFVVVVNTDLAEGNAVNLAVPVGDQWFGKTLVLVDRSYPMHIMVANDDGLVLMKKNDSNTFMCLNNDGTTFLVTLTTEIRDAVITSTKEIWFAAINGLYQWDYNQSKIVRSFSGEYISVAVTTSDVIYAIDKNQKLYFVQDGSLALDNSLAKPHRLAFTKDGDVFYTESWYSPVYKKSDKTPLVIIQLTGLPKGSTFVLEVDKRTDILFVCHYTGLYYLSPDKTHLLQVAGISWVVAIGNSMHGDLYISTAEGIVKMFPLISKTEANKQYQELQSNYSKIEEKYKVAIKKRDPNKAVVEIVKNCDEFDTEYIPKNTLSGGSVTKKTFDMSEINAKYTNILKEIESVFPDMKNDLNSKEAEDTNLHCDELQSNIGPLLKTHNTTLTELQESKRRYINLEAKYKLQLAAVQACEGSSVLGSRSTEYNVGTYTSVWYGPKFPRPSIFLKPSN